MEEKKERESAGEGETGSRLKNRSHQRLFTIVRNRRGPKGIDHKRDFPELAKRSSAFVCCFNVITFGRRDRRNCSRDETRM